MNINLNSIFFLLKLMFDITINSELNINVLFFHQNTTATAAAAAFVFTYSKCDYRKKNTKSTFALNDPAPTPRGRRKIYFQTLLVFPRRLIY